MTYLSGKAKKKKQFVIYFFYIIFFLIIILFWTIFKTNVSGALESVIIRYGIMKSGINIVPEFFHTYLVSRKNLTQKNKELEIIVENLENEIAEKDAKLKELDFISSEKVNTSGSSIIVMYPIMSDITKIYSTVILSKGYKDGVEKDAYVYVRGLQPVCIIKEVYNSTSLCQLISAGGIVTEAVIGGSSASSTLAVSLLGRGGGAFIGDVPRDTNIVIGDSVFLKSDPSMILGKVVDVLNNNQDTSWHIFVNGAYNPLTSSIFYIRKK